MEDRNIQTPCGEKKEISGWSRAFYETGIEEPEILGSGSRYSNVVCFQSEERAFEAFRKGGRNYLRRITYRNSPPYKTTELWDDAEKCWCLS